MNKINNKNNKKIYAKYSNEGFVLIKNFFDKSSILKIKKNLRDFLENNKVSLGGVNFVDNKTKKINTAHKIKNWKLLKKIQTNKKIIQIATKLLKCKIKEFGAEVFAKPAKVGLASPIHQDNFYWNIKNNKGITFWIALDRANKKNGSLFYYNKSHKLGLLPHKASFAPGSSQTIANLKKLKKFKKSYPEMNIGDVLIHDCLVAHGSKKNLSNKNRMGLTLRFIPANSKFNQKNKRKYQESLKSQTKKFN